MYSAGILQYFWVNLATQILYCTVYLRWGSSSRLVLYYFLWDSTVTRFKISITNWFQVCFANFTNLNFGTATTVGAATTRFSTRCAWTPSNSFCSLQTWTSFSSTRLTLWRTNCSVKSWLQIQWKNCTMSFWITAKEYPQLLFGRLIFLINFEGKMTVLEGFQQSQ